MQIVREEKTISDFEENKEKGMADPVEHKSAITLFEDFYRQVRDEELPETGRKIVTEIVKELQEH